MTAKTTELLDAAVNATFALATIKSESKADIELAFRKSAIATCEYVIHAKGKATDLAKANKVSGSGYGSDAAVGFHALTGLWLHLPVSETAQWDDENNVEPTAQRVQSLIKKIGQPKAKAILTKRNTNAQAAFRGIVAAVEALELDLNKVLKAAAKAIASVEAARLEGAELPEGAQQHIDAISLALHNIVLGAQPIAVEIVKTKSTVNA